MEVEKQNNELGGLTPFPRENNMNTSISINDRYRSNFIRDAIGTVIASVIGVLIYLTQMHELTVDAIPILIGVTIGALIADYSFWRKRDVVFLEHGLEGPTKFLRRVVIPYVDIDNMATRISWGVKNYVVESRNGKRIIISNRYFSRQQIREIEERVATKGKRVKNGSAVDF